MGNLGHLMGMDCNCDDPLLLILYAFGSLIFKVYIFQVPKCALDMSPVPSSHGFLEIVFLNLIRSL